MPFLRVSVCSLHFLGHRSKHWLPHQLSDTSFDSKLCLKRERESALIYGRISPSGELDFNLTARESNVYETKVLNNLEKKKKKNRARRTGSSRQFPRFPWFTCRSKQSTELLMSEAALNKYHIYNSRWKRAWLFWLGFSGPLKGAKYILEKYVERSQHKRITWLKKPVRVCSFVCAYMGHLSVIL